MGGNVPTDGIVGEGPDGLAPAPEEPNEDPALGEGFAAEPETPTSEPPRAGEPTPSDPPAADPGAELAAGAELDRGDAPAPALTPPVDGEPACPRRAPFAADGVPAGRAAAGVPPSSREEGEADPVEDPAEGRAAEEGAVAVDPVPAPGAAAMRAPKLRGAAGFVAAGELTPGELAAAVARLLAPKLGGEEGEFAPALDPAGCIVGTVEPAGSKSEPPENEDEGGGPGEGSNEPPEPT